MLSSVVGLDESETAISHWGKRARGSKSHPSCRQAKDGDFIMMIVKMKHALF